MDRGAWWATVLAVVKASDPTVAKQQQATQHGPPNKTNQLICKQLCYVFGFRLCLLVKPIMEVSTGF